VPIECPICGASYNSTVTVCPLDGTPLGHAATQLGIGDRTDPDRPLPANSADPTDPGSAAPSGVFDIGTVLGSYRIVGLIGQGGMGQVYLAEHVKLGRQVALKVLRSRWAADPEMLQRFFLEAKAVNQIRHPNIVEVTDWVEEGGLAYFIMELLSGRSLKQRIAEEGALPLPEVLRIARSIGDALAAVHQAGFIHRDLKPDNIFLHDAGDGLRVKLFDFGLAKLRRQGPEQAPDGNTDPKTILGTPEYMAPEQVRARPYDHRADLYSLGAILYETLTGARPISAPSLGELLVRVATEKPVPPSKLAPMAGRPVPPILEELILRCLEKEPELRPRDAGEILRELALVESELGGRPRAGSEPRGRPAPRRRRGLVIASSALLLAAVGITLIALRAPETPPATSGRAGEPIAKLAQLWGDVQHRERGGQSWRAAEPAQQLHYHDALRTGRAARSRVVFFQGGVIDLDEHSEVLIEPPATRGEAPLPVLVEGTLRGEARPGVPFRFLTPDRKVAVVEAKEGPARLRIRASKDRVDLSLLRGKAAVSGSGSSVVLGGAQLVELHAGKPSAPFALPAFPELLAPEVDAVLPAASVRLSWRPVPVARRYRLQVSRFTSFDENLVNNLVASHEAPLSGLEPGRYLWRVSSVSERGHEGEFGFARRFTVQPGPSPDAGATAAPSPALLAPVDGALVEHVRDPAPTRFRWRSEGGGRYLIVLTRGATLDEKVVLRRRVLGGSLTFGPLRPGTYLWGVYQLEGKTQRPLFTTAFRLKVVQRSAPDVRLRPIKWK
jgi:serine/threonine-protein kinase